MNEIIAKLTVSSVAVLLASVFYWQIANRVLIKHILYRLFARRDELRRLAIEGEEDANDFFYQELETFLCKIIYLVKSVNLVGLIWILIRRSNLDMSNILKFNTEASEKLISIKNKALKDLILASLINSPLVTLFSVVLLLLLFILGRLGKGLRASFFKKAESFVADIPRDSDFLRA